MATRPSFDSPIHFEMQLNSKATSAGPDQTHDQPPPLRINTSDKFFSKLLSRENSSSVSSKALYYGGIQSSIPFGWESQPGTPKTAAPSSKDGVIMPLTPPPSSYCSLSSASSSSSSSSSGSPKSPNSTKVTKNASKGHLTNYLSPSCVASRLKASPKRARMGSFSMLSTSSPSSLSSFSSSSSSWSWSGPLPPSLGPASRLSRERYRRYYSRSQNSALAEHKCGGLGYGSSDRNENNDKVSRSCESTPKFVVARKRASGSKFKGCFALTGVKKVILSIVGGRSSQQ